MKTQSIDTKQTFWLNVERYMRLNGISVYTLSKRIDSKQTVVNELMHKKSNLPIGSVSKYARALEVQPIDLFEVWSDEEWQTMRKEQS
ncbi:helix-turn-helix domain-containing protein [Jeotgalibaca arthritidis]|uniref:helix-turn-helix domain-containing protein n=1 Tax=Jeotgalibaca arthritidis TaxID=1868794 RepID=UPI0035A0F78A